MYVYTTLTGLVHVYVCITARGNVLLYVFILGVDSAVVTATLTELQKAGYDSWRTTVGGPGVGLHYGEQSETFVIPGPLRTRAELCHIL